MPNSANTYYVIQSKKFGWEKKWITWENRRFPTLAAGLGLRLDQLLEAVRDTV